MAIAGGMTTAYTYTPQGDSGTVRIEKTTRPHSLCDKPHDAAARVLAGEAATVAGADAVVMRALLAKAGKVVRA